MNENLKISDDELMLSFQKGDESAFNEIVRRYKINLANFVFRFIGSYDDSLDIVQETFIRVFKSRHNYKNIAKFSTWIYTIASNLAKTELRRRKRYQIFTLNIFSSKSDESTYDIPDTSYMPDIETDKIIRSTIVQKGLNKLAPIFKEVLILRDIMELSYDEISVITRLPVGTVKSRINRGRLLLHDILIKIKNQL